MTKVNRQILSIVVTIILFVFVFACSNSNNSTKSQSDEWYVGGTLHKATVSEWKNATERNKLATCADIVASIKKFHNDSYNGDVTSMKRDAIQMMNCIDETVKGNVAENANMKINEIAAACSILFDAKK
jgi:hypothetical protein